MIFKENYFKKETRQGFEISEMMKRAWAAQMEVLQIVIEVCEKNKLQYFADWGTLLGAVRHQGFIPWDDDIDICLKREDYNHLIQILPEQLPHGFVMAGMYAQTERLRLAAEVPQLRVMADETMWDFNDYMRYFHGFPYQRAGIDIFPLDYIPVDEGLTNIQKVIIQQGNTLLENWVQLEMVGSLEAAIEKFEEVCNVKLNRKDDIRNAIWRLTDAVASLYREEESEYLTNYAFWITLDHYKMKKEWYDEVVMLPFENMEIAAPAKYHEALKAQFGDYMVPVQGKADHSYLFYGHMERELIKQIRAVGFQGSIDEFCREVSSGRLRV